MKKLFSLLLAALLMLTTAVMADGVDLAQMTDNDVLALLEQVNAEIVSRGIAKTATLPKGAYIVGRDLPAGRYIFTCLATGDDWGNVTVYSEGGKGKQLLWEVVSAPENGESPETFMVTLSDGDQLKSGVPFSLTIMAGVVFK